MATNFMQITSDIGMHNIMDKTTLKINTSVIRQVQKEHGVFDGRFKTKSIPSKKDYSRKFKHKLNSSESGA